MGVLTPDELAQIQTPDPILKDAVDMLAECLDVIKDYELLTTSRRKAIAAFIEEHAT